MSASTRNNGPDTYVRFWHFCAMVKRSIHILFFFAFNGLNPPSAVQCLNQEACAK